MDLIMTGHFHMLLPFVWIRLSSFLTFHFLSLWSFVSSNSSLLLLSHTHVNLYSTIRRYGVCPLLLYHLQLDSFVAIGPSCLHCTDLLPPWRDFFPWLFVVVCFCYCEWDFFFCLNIFLCKTLLDTWKSYYCFCCWHVSIFMKIFILFRYFW